jgi:hypothetical protein
MSKPKISVVFSNDTFVIRKNYTDNQEYIALPKAFASPIFDGTRCVIQDTRTREQYPIIFYKNTIAADQIFSYLLLDLYGLEGLPPFPNTEGRTLYANITADPVASAISLKVRISEYDSDTFDLYTQNTEQIETALNTFINQTLGLAGTFTVTMQTVTEGARLGVSVQCADCWAESMMLIIDNGGAILNQEFILD